MKKFFALMLVVAMLSVAGSAMAVTVTVSGDYATVNMKAGETQTVTVLISADYPNTGIISSVDLTTAANWITSGDLNSSGDNFCSLDITFAPGSNQAAGNYTAIVTAYETYTSGDEVGHTPSYEILGAVTIYVKIVAAEEKVETVTNVPVIDVAVATLAGFTELQNSSGAVAQLQNPTLKAAVAQTLTTILQAVGIQVNANAVVAGAQNIQKAENAKNYIEGDDEGNLQKAAAQLKEKVGSALARVAGVTEPFKVVNTAFQALGFPEFAAVFYGLDLGLDMGENNTAASTFSASAATGTNQVVFLNSKGEQITKVPDGTDGATAGKVTAVAYVEAGKTYEPILFVTFPSAASMDSFDEYAGTTVVKEVSIVVTSGEPAPVDPWGGKTYLIDVPQASIDLIASIDNRTLRTLVAATVADPETDTTQVYNVGGVSKDVVASLPIITNIAPNAAGEAYILAFKYSRPSVVGRTISGDPEFYPQGPTGDQKGRVYNNTGLATLSDIVTGNIGYVVFAVASNDTFASFYAANADFASPRVLATSVPVVSPTPTPTYDRGTSSSSGGCSAGSAALALAVLGSFILTRKK